MQNNSSFEKFVRQILENDLVRSTKMMLDVIKELQKFSEKGVLHYLSYHALHRSHTRFPALPMFFIDEKERATMRYINITTIATFFSSVTATVLQTSITMNANSTMWNVVNFFWFISLVFSVSSGVSSMLGMTWRKSIMWVTT